MAGYVPLPRSKPPFLRRVRIRGYKSIEYCDVTLEPLTVLVGRNGSGKSNFLDAVQFFRELLTFGRRRLKDRGGWAAVTTRGVHPAEVEFETTLDFSIGGRPLEAYLQIRVGQDGDDPVVLAETAMLRPGGPPEVASTGLSRTASGVTGIGAVDLQRVQSLLSTPELARVFRSTSLFTLLGYKETSAISDKMAASKLYHFLVDELKKLQLIDTETILESDGSNLPQIVKHLTNNAPDDFRRICDYMAVVVPEFRDVRSVQYGEYETLQFLVGGKGEWFDARSVSDGTLRALSALVAVYQTDSSHRPPGFVAIEEPETALHPAAMHALVDALDEATLRTQILLTTHSADLLDNPTIRPENVRVVEMIDGRTVIAPVDAAGVEIVRRKLNTLGGLEREGQLAPDMADVERQRQAAGAPPA